LQTTKKILSGLRGSASSSLIEIYYHLEEIKFKNKLQCFIRKLCEENVRKCQKVFDNSRLADRFINKIRGKKFFKEDRNIHSFVNSNVVMMSKNSAKSTIKFQAKKVRPLIWYCKSEEKYYKRFESTILKHSIEEKRVREEIADLHWLSQTLWIARARSHAVNII